MMRGGLLSGRHRRSPLPDHIDRPSESCTSGRQSIAVCFLVSEYQYIDVSGAMPKRDTAGAYEQGRFDVHRHALAALEREAVGADDRGPLHQRVDDQRVVALLGVDIELGEVGELFRTVGDRDVERNSARRQAVLVEFADGAEISGAEKGDPVVLAPIERAVARLLDAQTGEAGALRQTMRHRIGGHVEIGLVVDDLARLTVLDRIHVDGLLEEQAEVEEGDGKASGSVGEQGVVGAKADLAPFLVVDLLNDVGRRTGRRRIGAVRPFARLSLEEIERKGRRLAEGESVRRRSRILADGGDRRGGGCAHQHCAAVNGIRHSRPSFSRDQTV